MTSWRAVAAYGYPNASVHSWHKLLLFCPLGLFWSRDFLEAGPTDCHLHPYREVETSLQRTWQRLIMLLSGWGKKKSATICSLSTSIQNQIKISKTKNKQTQTNTNKKQTNTNKQIRIFHPKDYVFSEDQMEELKSMKIQEESSSLTASQTFAASFWITILTPEELPGWILQFHSACYHRPSHTSSSCLKLQWGIPDTHPVWIDVQGITEFACEVLWIIKAAATNAGGAIQEEKDINCS